MYLRRYYVPIPNGLSMNFSYYIVGANSCQENLLSFEQIVKIEIFSVLSPTHNKTTTPNNRN